MADKTVLISQQFSKPIKILKWKVSQGNSMSIGRVILLYDFEGATKVEQRKLKSSQAGTVRRLIAQEGAIVKRGEALLELAPCIHPTVMKDMCAECGADLRKDDLVMTASVPMVHAIPELKVSEELAQKLGKADGDRLLKDRKLVLLVDLDQTLIHTTNDNIPPNIKDVYHFQLYGPSSPWYHTRLRPGTHQFLENVSPMYELHICTFGARNYAHTITMFLDGDERFFSNRILSRDECFDPTSKKANLKALFPCGDNMVCIIDDREDVWSHASNLIHVKPYHFFQHTGDINAPPGLDKHEDDNKPGVDLTKVKVKSKTTTTLEKANGKNVKTTSPKKLKNKEETNGDIKDEKDNERDIRNNGLDEKICENEEIKQEAPKAEKEEKMIGNMAEEKNKDETKKDEMPEDEMKQKESSENKAKKEELSEDKVENEELSEDKMKKVGSEDETKKDESSEDETKKEELSEDKMEEELPEDKMKTVEMLDEKPKNNGNAKDESDEIEIDDPDDYLLYLEDILKKIHKAFYDQFDVMESGSVPDLKQVIPTVRGEVLRGCHLVFSGLVPTHVKLQDAKAYQVARSLGATVAQDLQDETTHLVAVRPGTAKVNAGRRRKGIKIVTPDWLWACAERWEHVEETIFPLSSKGSKNRHPPPHCSSPEHVPNYPTHDAPGTRKRTPSGRFMDTINPLMTLSRDDIANMGKEVEDILDDDSESEDEAQAQPTVNEKPQIEEERDSSSSSDDSMTGEFPRGFKRSRREMEGDDTQDPNDSSADEFPSIKFRRGEELDDRDLDIEDSNSVGSDEEPDEVGDCEWNMMGAALEREFLSNN